MGETFWRLTDEFAPHFLCVSIQPDYGFDWDQLEHNVWTETHSVDHACKNADLIGASREAW